MVVSIMFGRCMRRLLVGIFGTPHCGQCDAHLGRTETRCPLSAAARRRHYIEGGPWQCARLEAGHR